MVDCYTKAEDGFFGDESSDDTLTMNVIPNETSDWYIALTHPTDVAAAFLKAHKDETTTWSEVPEESRSVQLKYYKALYEKKHKIGIRQRDEVTGSIRFNPSEDREDDSYAHHFGNELPTIETVDAMGDELLALESQEGVAKDSDGEPTWPEGSTKEIGRGLTPRFPVIDGKALPHYVTTESELEDALELIAQIPDEPAIPENQLNPLEETARAMGVKPDYIEAEMEGKNRTTAIEALEGRRNHLMHQGESNNEVPQDEVIEGESSSEAKAGLANTLIEGGMDPEKALDRVQNL